MDQSQFWAAALGAVVGGAATFLAELVLAKLRWKERYSDALVERQVTAALSLHNAFSRTRASLYSFPEPIHMEKLQSGGPVQGEPEARAELENSVNEMSDLVDQCAPLVSARLLAAANGFVCGLKSLLVLATTREELKRGRAALNEHYSREIPAAFKAMTNADDVRCVEVKELEKSTSFGVGLVRNAVPSLQGSPGAQ